MIKNLLFLLLFSVLLYSCTEKSQPAPKNRRVKTISIYLIKNSKKLLSEKRGYNEQGQIIYRSSYFPEAPKGTSPEHKFFKYNDNQNLVKEIHSKLFLTNSQIEQLDELNDSCSAIITYNDNGDTLSQIDLCKRIMFRYNYDELGVILEGFKTVQLKCEYPQNPIYDSIGYFFSRDSEGNLLEVQCEQLNIHKVYKNYYYNGLLLKITSNGQTLQNAKYKNGKLVRVTKFINSPRLKFSTDFKYNSEGQLINECSFSQSRDIMFPDYNNCKKIEYDESGDTLKIIYYQSGGTNTQRISDKNDSSISQEYTFTYKYF